MPAAIQERPVKKASKKQGSKKTPVSTQSEQAVSSTRLPAPAAAANGVQAGETSAAPPVSVTLALLPEVAAALHAEAQKRGTTLEAVALDALHQGLRQILWGGDPAVNLKRMGLVPRKPLPPGVTLKQVLAETPWPHDEPDATDEEYNRALEELS